MRLGLYTFIKLQTSRTIVLEVCSFIKVYRGAWNIEPFYSAFTSRPIVVYE